VSGRIHSGYLISGAGDAPREAALEFARAIVCGGEGDGERPCEVCRSCRLSGAESKTVKIDGRGKKGPFFRHIGEHADLYWVERGSEDTRVRVDQIRKLRSVLSRAGTEGGRRAAVIGDARWLNAEAQNALLRVLEEPPPQTSLLLVTNSASSLLATIRSRCVRVAFPGEAVRDLRSPEEPESVRSLVARLDKIHALGLPQLLDWAEEYRGKRAVTVEQVDELLAVSCDWLHERVLRAVAEGRTALGDELDAYRTVLECRRELTRRNTNSQMTAEKSLFAIRSAVRS
jgi:hypothetical protein